MLSANQEDALLYKRITNERVEEHVSWTNLVRGKYCSIGIGIGIGTRVSDVMSTSKRKPRDSEADAGNVTTGSD